MGGAKRSSPGSTARLAPIPGRILIARDAARAGMNHQNHRRQPLPPEDTVLDSGARKSEPMRSEPGCLPPVVMPLRVKLSGGRRLMNGADERLRRPVLESSGVVMTHSPRGKPGLEGDVAGGDAASTC